MSRPHIFQLITHARKGGAQAHVQALLANMHDRYQMSLACGEEGYLMDQAARLGINTYYLPELIRLPSPLRDRQAYRRLVTILQRENPDLLHTHSTKAGVLGRQAASRLGIKNVYTAHGWAFAEGIPLLQRMAAFTVERALVKKTHKIITVSHYDERLALRLGHHAASRTVTIHNGIPDISYNRANRNTQQVRLVCVARFVRQKNHACLLEAVARLNGHFGLQLVGEGPLIGNINRKLNRRTLREKVTLLPRCNDVIPVLSQADIFVLSSDWEGLPISVLEAMRAGLPVVATNVGGVSEAVVHGSNGLLVQRNDDTALAEMLETLTQDATEREAMGKAGRQRYMEHFTLDKMLRDTTRVYEEVLAQS